MSSENPTIICCPNCSNELEENHNFCPNCGCKNINGYILASNDYAEEISSESKYKSLLTKLKNKKFYLPIVVVIALLIIISSVCANVLSSYEKTALEKTEFLINHMKDPDSFKLQSDIICLKVVSDIEKYNGEEIYYIEYSARNGFGGTTTSVACFFNGRYIDLDDTSINNVNTSDYNTIDDYLSAAEEEIERYATVSTLNDFYYDWVSYGDESSSTEEAIIINAKKIAKKAKCDFSDKA